MIIEFPSHDEANIFYNSKEYQEAHAILKGFAIRQADDDDDENGSDDEMSDMDEE